MSDTTTTTPTDGTTTTPPADTTTPTTPANSGTTTTTPPADSGSTTGTTGRASFNRFFNSGTGTTTPPATDTGGTTTPPAPAPAAGNPTEAAIAALKKSGALPADFAGTEWTPQVQNAYKAGYYKAGGRIFPGCPTYVPQPATVADIPEAMTK